MSTGDQSTVMVEARIAPALVVIETKLAFQLPVVELDGPAQAGEAGQTFGLGVFGEVREPVVGWGVLPLGPLDDEPLGAGRQMVAQDGVGGRDPDEGEAAFDLLPGRGRAAGEHLEGRRGQLVGQSGTACGA